MALHEDRSIGGSNVGTSLYDTEAHDIGSIASKSQRYSTHHVLRQRWSSTYSYVSSMLVSMCTIYYFDVALEHRNFRHMDFLMMIVSFILIALPLFYMQVLLGQYTQSGVICLRHMSPLGHGIAFGFLLVTFAHSIKLGIYAADFLTYLTQSFRYEIEWLGCSEKYRSVCWNGYEPCEVNNCLNETIKPSTYYYYRDVYCNRRGLNQNTTVQMPNLHRSMLILLFWLLVCLIINIYTIKFRKIITKLWTITFVLLIMNTINMWVRDYNIEIIVDILVVNTTALLNTKAWLKVIADPINLMGLAKGIHILHGSFIDIGETREGSTVLVTILDILVMTMTMSFGRASLYKLRSTANMTRDVFRVYWVRGVEMYFVSIPMALSLCRIPQMWNILYFLTCLLLTLGNQLMHLVTLERSFCDAYPTILKYSKYVSSIICIIIVAISTCISSKYFPEAFTVEAFSFCFLSTMESLVVFLFAVFVCWLYGVQKFCDDIHYMRGSQPAMFWKVTWNCLPVLLGVSLVTKFLHYNIGILHFDRHEIICLTIFLIPIPAVTVYEIFRSIRKKNVTGLFHSEEEYGPPDPKERRLRKLFNPRQETKLKRKSEKCNHRCLLHSKVLKRAVGEEENYKKSGNLSIYSENEDNLMKNK
nr:sodium-dependent nutrient amino acid transporter 1-like [Onthophagus taurus]